MFQVMFCRGNLILTILTYVFFTSFWYISAEAVSNEVKSENLWYTPWIWKYQDSKVSANNRTFSIFIIKGDTRKVLFDVVKPFQSLIVSVTPCTSILEWSLHFKEHANSYRSDHVGDTGILLKNTSGLSPGNFMVHRASIGKYELKLRAVNSDTYVHLFISFHIPEFLFSPPRGKIKISHDDRYNNTVIEWKRCRKTFDENRLSFCLVINSRRFYHSLCEATGHRYGVILPAVSSSSSGKNFRSEFGYQNPIKRLRKNILTRQNTAINDVTVGCIGKKQTYVVQNKEYHRSVYLSVFATDEVTNFSFLFAKQKFKRNPNLPLNVKMDHPVRLNMARKIKKSFIYNHQSYGDLWIIANFCQNTYKITLHIKNATLDSKPFQGFMYISFLSLPKNLYYISLVKENHGNVKSHSNFMYILFTKDKNLIMYPQLPSDRSVTILRDEISCDNTKIGWKPSQDPKSRTYCIVVKLLTAEFFFNNRKNIYPDQCGRMIPFFRDERTVVTYCYEESIFSNRSLLTQKLNNLKPSSKYMVQVLLKKTTEKGKMLSYNYAFFETPKCDGACAACAN